jgi:hypothetical protein
MRLLAGMSRRRRVLPPRLAIESFGIEDKADRS